MQQSAGQIPNAKQASDATPHILDSVPSTLPALAQCQRISELAAGEYTDIVLLFGFENLAGEIAIAKLGL